MTRFGLISSSEETDEDETEVSSVQSDETVEALAVATQESDEETEVCPMCHAAFASRKAAWQHFRAHEPEVPLASSVLAAMGAAEEDVCGHCHLPFIGLPCHVKRCPQNPDAVRHGKWRKGASTLVAKRTQRRWESGAPSTRRSNRASQVPRIDADVDETMQEADDRTDGESASAACV